jgi:hypothetical protein
LKTVLAKISKLDDHQNEAYFVALTLWPHKAEMLSQLKTDIFSGREM